MKTTKHTRNFQTLPRTRTLAIAASGCALFFATLIRVDAFSPVARFVRGDTDGSGRIELNDVVASLEFFLFNLGPLPSCPDALDFDDTGVIDLSDPIGTLVYLFLGTTEPAAPGSECGYDPTPDTMAPCAPNPEVCPLPEPEPSPID